MKLSAYSKAIVAGAIACAAAVAGMAPNTAIGKWCVAIGALAAALGLTAATKNTHVVKTGSGTEPVTVGDVVASTGEKVGTVVADTGAATGGVLAGTTGVVGTILDGTLGKLLPKL